jgi:hypothetical protein
MMTLVKNPNNKSSKGEQRKKRLIKQKQDMELIKRCTLVFYCRAGGKVVVMQHIHQVNF